MAQKLYEESNIQAIADAIRGKNGLTNTYKTSEMAAAITAIEGGGGDLPEEALTITGNCSYRFANGGWDWFVENYGDRVTTSNITDANKMFFQCEVENIPFEINFTTKGVFINNMFSGCSNLKSIPKINNCKTQSMDNLFSECRNLRNLPEDIETYFDWSYLDNLTSTYSGAQSYLFQGCYSLRSIPIDFLSHGNPNINYSSTYFMCGFNNCYTLDELIGLPIPYTVTWKNNSFSDTFNHCYRIKNITFKTPDGQPYVKQWKSQIIDLSKWVGYSYFNSYVVNYNSGITADKEVKDDATYQALKDDPDWFTTQVEYSRYNHDSAVATINSLPDTSAYLATAGGTNTIKFKGAAGSATEGGAINTLTEEEIAVATAKGWSVVYV